MTRITLALVLAVLAVLPARADLVIRSSPGGWVTDYLATFARVRQSGEKVIIDGPCLSACTLVLSTVPSNRICVTKRAVLGFHAPRIIDRRSGKTARAPEATRIVIDFYPPGVAPASRSGAASAEAHPSARPRAAGYVPALLAKRAPRGSRRGHPLPGIGLRPRTSG